MKTAFDFMQFKKISYTISIALSVISICYALIYKFNFGIDFTGGINIEMRTTHSPDLARMRKVLNDLNIGEVMLQTFGQENDVSIRVGTSSETKLAYYLNLIKETLKNSVSYDIDYRKVDFVSPQVGEQLIFSGALALLLSFLTIMIYVWIRFEWYFGVGVLVALIHDAIISLGFMSISRLDFNLSTIAAILTIIGYSVNDSVVIYDRIQQNIRKFSKKSLAEIINLSVNETLSRTILTVLTTLIANLALILFGGEALRSFSVLVFVGIVVATYSSIFIGAPVLTLFTHKTKS